LSFVEVSRDDHITTVTLDRPEALNAISGAVADELAEAFRRVAADEETWVMLLAAAGDRAFSVGADLKERAGFTMDDHHAIRKKIRGLFEALRAVPQPTIACIFGHALGGGFELALSCDLIVAAEDAAVGLPEARVGLLPAGGGTQLLTRRVGPSRAKDMILRARLCGAEKAVELGLVDRIGSLEDARTLAEEICKQSPIAVRAAKRAIDAALGVPLEDGIEIEHASWEVVIASDDRAEGIAAFNEKREPKWRNR
jgi:enoyl-CoA hydratase/carnithine racemase